MTPTTWQRLQGTAVANGWAVTFRDITGMEWEGELAGPDRETRTMAFLLGKRRVVAMFDIRGGLIGTYLPAGYVGPRAEGKAARVLAELVT